MFYSHFFAIILLCLYIFLFTRKRFLTLIFLSKTSKIKLKFSSLFLSFSIYLIGIVYFEPFPLRSSTFQPENCLTISYNFGIFRLKSCSHIKLMLKVTLVNLCEDPPWGQIINSVQITGATSEKNTPLETEM